MADLLDSWFGVHAAEAGPSPSRNPADERWWSPSPPTISDTGLRITTEDVLKASAALACVRVLADTIAALPLIVYQRREDGGKERAPDHPLFEVLRYQPNPVMTAFDFWQMALVFALLWGTFYARIVPGPRGFADTLQPLHSDDVRVETMQDGRLRYIVNDRTKPAPREQEVLLQDEVFRLPGLSLDGKVGLNILYIARETVALELAAEGYAARMFRNDARPAGILTTEQQLSEEAAKSLREAWINAYAGPANSHGIAVLGKGSTYARVGDTAKDSQLVESRKQQALEIARVFRVQPHKIGILDRATFSNIEQQAVEFLQDTLMPWLVRIQQAVRRDLILAPARYFAEYLVDARMWADSKQRGEYYSLMWNLGSLSSNDIRIMENMNPVPGGDRYFVPVNMQPADQASGAMQRARALARAAAERVVRREISAVTKEAQHNADDPARWAEKVRALYTEHERVVSEALQLDPARAAAYCTEQREAVLEGGVAAMDGWETDAVARLVDMAMGG